MAKQRQSTKEAKIVKMTTALARRSATGMAKAKVKATEPESQTIVGRLVELASDPNVDVTKINALIDANERVMKMQAKAAFEAAFAAMQGEIPIITRDGTIVVEGKVRSTFASNANIQRTVKPILSKYGFSLRFRHKRSKHRNELDVTGILSHVGGHFEEDTFTTERDDSGKKNAIQSWGSARSYGQRYVTRALLNIADENEDTDGFEDGDVSYRDERPSRPASATKLRQGHNPNAARASAPPKPPPPAKVAPPRPAGGTEKEPWMNLPIMEEQRRHFHAVFQNSGRLEATVKAWLKVSYGVDNTKDLKRRDFEAVIAALQTKGPLVTMASEDADDDQPPVDDRG